MVSLLRLMYVYNYSICLHYACPFSSCIVILHSPSLTPSANGTCSKHRVSYSFNKLYCSLAQHIIHTNFAKGLL